MSFSITDLFGGGVIQKGLDIIDKFIPDAAAKEKAKLDYQIAMNSFQLEEDKISAQLAQGQIDTNKIEAASESIFKSGWRPFMGWSCGAGFVYMLVARPLLMGFLSKYNFIFPELDAGTLTALTSGMLGLGVFRTYEKTNAPCKTVNGDGK
jgi:hypothetical protein